MTAETWELDPADEPLNDEDLTVLASIRRLFEAVDPVPPNLVSQIEFQITLEAMFDEVDRLQQVQVDYAGARSTEQIKTVTFTGADVSLMLTVNDLGAGDVRVDGWVTPGGGWNVALSVPGEPFGHVTAVADTDGRFVFERVSAVLSQFTVHRPVEGDKAFTTPLIQL